MFVSERFDSAETCGAVQKKAMAWTELRAVFPAVAHFVKFRGQPCDTSKGKGFGFGPTSASVVALMENSWVLP